MDFVREHLTTKKNVNFEDNQERSNNIELEVLADTVYLKVKIIFNNFPQHDRIKFRSLDLTQFVMTTCT